MVPASLSTRAGRDPSFEAVVAGTIRALRSTGAASDRGSAVAGLQHGREFVNSAPDRFAATFRTCARMPPCGSRSAARVWPGLGGGTQPSNVEAHARSLLWEPDCSPGGSGVGEQRALRSDRLHAGWARPYGSHGADASPLVFVTAAADGPTWFRLYPRPDLYRIWP